MVGRRSDRSQILTLANLLSLLRIVLIPVFFALIVGEGTEVAGLLLFAVVASTDWVDGYVARRTGRVTEVGKVLDPLADRLAIAAALVAVVLRDAFPVWAALLILVRDIVVVLAGATVLAMRGVRIDVRRGGKAATLLLMVAVPCVAWSALGLPLATPVSIVGWACYGVGIALSYGTTVRYAADVRRAWSGASTSEHG